MARIRTVKPAFFRHEGLQDLEAANPGACVMLVFAGLWGHCDKAGRFEWRPRQLKLDILPFLNFDMAATLDLLREAGFVQRYEVAGKQYGFVPTFGEHQRVSGKEAQEPETHPAPPETQSGNSGEATGKQPGRQEEEGKGVQEEEGERERGAADDARTDLAKAQDAVLDALGVRKDPRWFGDAGRVSAWLGAGASLELDVLPTIKRLLAKRGGDPPRNLKYFDQAIADAKASRLAPLPAGQAKPGQTPILSGAEMLARAKY